MVVARVLELLAFLYLAVVSVVLARTDLRMRILPNRVVLPSGLVGGALLGTASALERDGARIVTMLVGGAALFALYFAVALISPRGMGFGDVKLAGVLGLFLGHRGWGPLLVGAVAAFLLGGLYATGLLVAGRARRDAGIPFGPWMLAGAWLGIAMGDPLLDAYLGFIGLSEALGPSG